MREAVFEAKGLEAALALGGDQVHLLALVMGAGLLLLLRLPSLRLRLAPLVKVVVHLGVKGDGLALGGGENHHHITDRARGHLCGCRGVFPDRGGGRAVVSCRGPVLQAVAVVTPLTLEGQEIKLATSLQVAALAQVKKFHLKRLKGKGRKRKEKEGKG